MANSDPSVVETAPAPAPGWAQRLIAVGLAILGALPSSGLFGPSSVMLKIAGLCVIGLAAAGYGTHSAALKAAHAAGVEAGAQS